MELPQKYEEKSYGQKRSSHPSKKTENYNLNPNPN